MHNISYTHQAQKDLHHIYDYIAQDNDFYAEKVVQHIVWFINGMLATFPHIGQHIDNNLHDITEPTFKYKIIYTISDDTITIIGVYKRQDR